MTAIDESPSTAQPAPPSRRRWPWIVGGITAGLLLAIAGAASYAWLGSPASKTVPTPTSASADYRARAVDACHERAKEDLVSPGSAQFSGEKISGGANTVFGVDGTVDSQNSFGGLLRSHYSCTVDIAGPTILHFEIW
jgi:hypothetical protein